MTELEKTLQTSQAEINRLNDLIALKDKLYTQTYIKAMEYEDKIEELKEALKVKEATISRLEQELEELKNAITDKTILNALRAALGIFIGIDFFDLYFENDCGLFQNTFSQKGLLPG